MRRAAFHLGALALLTAAPAHADWQTFIQKQNDGTELAVMQGTAQYNFAFFLLCKKDGEKHVLLQMGNTQTPIAEMKAKSDVALTIKTDDGEHTSIGVWATYGTGQDLLEYANFYETKEVATFIGNAKGTVVFIYNSPSLKVHDGAVAFADGAAEAAQKFNAFCPD